MYGFSPAHAGRLAQEAKLHGRTFSESERREQLKAQDAQFRKTCPQGFAGALACLEYYFGLKGPIRSNPDTPKF